MKKIVTSILAAAMALSMVACGDTPATAKPTNGADATTKAWPKGNIELYVPAKAGGATDLYARIVATYLEGKTGKSVSVINNADGGGVVAYEMVRNADPDGLKLMLFHTGVVTGYWTGVYDQTYEQFTVLGTVGAQGSSAYVAAANAPYNTFEEFVAYSKEHPAGVKFGVQMGGATHVMGCALEQEAGIKLKMVEAGSNADKLAAIAGGHVDVTNTGLSTALQYVQDGTLKILAVTDKTEDSGTLPVLSDLGYSFTATSYCLLWGPAGMDTGMVSEIDAILADFQNDTEAQSQFKNLGYLMEFINSADAAKFVAERHTAEGEATAAAGLNVRQK